MYKDDHIQKSIFYILIQILTLWSIFHQLAATEQNGEFEVVGLIILTSVFLFYAHKTIKLLGHTHSRHEEERSAEHS